MASKDIISQVYRRLFNVIVTVCPARESRQARKVSKVFPSYEA